MAGKLLSNETREKHRWGNNKFYTRKNHKNGVKITNDTDSNVSVPQEPAQQPVATTADDYNVVSLKQPLSQKKSRTDVSEDSSAPIHVDGDVGNTVMDNVVVNGDELDLVSVRFENRIKINVTAARSKSEIGKVRRKLVSELELVRSSLKSLEAKELQLSESSQVHEYGSFQDPVDVDRDSGPLMVNSKVVSVENNDSRLFPPLSVVVTEDKHNGFNDSYEKDNRTPSMSNPYSNTDFDLRKDRSSVQGKYKKLTNGFGPSMQLARALKSCSNLLTRLGKHKYSWVFKTPVDAVKWNLHDYHTIIKHPMDLGTIRTKLTNKMYKSPIEFAEDVRLTFCNAMTYNPKGHDVHTMAEDFLRIFEEKWAIIEAEYSRDFIPDMRHDMELRTPTSRKIPTHLQPLPLPSLTRDRPIPMTAPVNSRIEYVHPTPNLDLHKNTSPKKIKPLVRDMTFDEKQNLGLRLESLPHEKLDHLFQIIRKHSSALSQQDGEIEVDIDILDAETLWELDRFVSDNNKSLSQDKANETHHQPRIEPEPAAMNPPTRAAMEVDEPKAIRKENGSMAIQLDKQEKDKGKSSSSSSSGSDSGSSSSDSDSESSSGSESNPGSPKT